MKNSNKHTKNEYVESWDAGTYQTGNTTPPKRSSPLVSVLLMLVIFLGGIASALGLVNMRLLTALRDAQPDPTVPLHLQAGTESATSPIAMAEEPRIPEGDVSITLVDPAVQTAEEMTGSAYLARVNGTSVTVSGGASLSAPGLVLTQDGYILTYAHVLRQEQIYVSLPDGSLHRAAVVGSDDLTDLAVIYIDVQGLIPAQFCDTAESYRVWTNRQSDLNGGAVCPDPSVFSLGGSQIALKQTSAASNADEGALWNSNCQVVGMLSPCITHYFNEDPDALAWVIPSGTVKQIVDDILCCGHVPGRPTLNIRTEEVTDLYRNYWQLPTGLRITGSENPDLEEGDILMRLDDTVLTSGRELNGVLFSAQPGQTMQATVIRDGETVHVTVTVDEEQCED